ncbi:Uncharacterised protein [Klebsiella pneumoniae]|nr:Uncharacterised protein [Klebsiella pneumoniae]
MGGNRVITLCLRFLIAETQGKKLTDPLNSMLCFADSVFFIIEKACQRLADTVPVVAVFAAACQPGNQQGTFNQPLCINHRIIGL